MMPKKKAESVADLKNVQFIYGDEEVRLEESLRRLRELLSREASLDFNFEVLNAPEAGVERIIDSAETLPLASRRRVVIVRDVDLLPSAEQSRLAEYLDETSPSTVLVLVAHFPEAGEPRDEKAASRIERSALFKKAKAIGETAQLTFGRKKQRKKNLDAWLIEQFRKRGKSIDPAARQVLLERVGDKPRDLEDAVERICLFSAGAVKIGEEEIEQVVVPAGEQGVFEFLDAVGDRRRDRSLYLLNRLLAQGEQPQRLLNALLGRFRLMARLKSMAPRAGAEEIAGELNLHPYYVNKCMQQARKYSAERLRSAFLQFRNAQVALHSTASIDRKDYQANVLEMMLVEIIG